MGGSFHYTLFFLFPLQCLLVCHNLYSSLPPYLSAVDKIKLEYQHQMLLGGHDQHYYCGTRDMTSFITVILGTWPPTNFRSLVKIGWGFLLVLLLGKIQPTPSSTGTELQTGIELGNNNNDNDNYDNKNKKNNKNNKTKDKNTTTSRPRATKTKTCWGWAVPSSKLEVVVEVGVGITAEACHY